MLVSEAIRMAIMGKLDRAVLESGISYFSGPLLNWTLVGVFKMILGQFQKSG
jgi:mediator of RNA polymerase II transcription subunit 5